MSSSAVALPTVWPSQDRRWRAAARAASRVRAVDEAAEGASLLAALQPELQGRGSLVVHLCATEAGAGTTRVARAIATAAGRHDWCQTMRLDATNLGRRTSSGPSNGGAPGLLAILRATGALPARVAGEQVPFDTMPLANDGIIPRLADLAALYETLRTHYPLILVEAPPVTLVPETAILASLADRTLLVARAERTRRRDLATSQALLAGAGAQGLAAVLNGTRRRLPAFLDRLL